MAIPFKLFGMKLSRMNPNLCDTCESHFTDIMKTKQISLPATVLFADIRGYTSLSQLTDSQEVSTLLGGFYDRCADAIWKRDGIVNKLIGDAIFAVFNFPITRKDHVEQAVYAGLELQKKCMEMKSLSGRPSANEVDFGIGVGIHTGDVSVGEIGQLCRDFTVIGEVVNLGSRLQGAAKPGEVVLSEAVYEKVKYEFPGILAQTFALKGINQPVRAYILVPD